ncbi:MAG TPA: CHASE domain-containing protein, partial [Oscillatoriaceae cyanobacterium]
MSDSPEPQLSKTTFVSRAKWPVALTLVLGVALSFAAFDGVKRTQRAELAGRFEHVTGHLDLMAHLRLARDLDVLYSLRDAFDASGTLSRRQFSVIARAQLARHPGILALEWVPVVPASKRAAFEAAARREGLKSFQLTEQDARGHLVPAAPRATYFPIFYVEPLAGNEPALGYAPALAPRDAAIAAARDDAHLTVSQAFSLVQGHRVGFAAFLPVYASTTPPVSVHERRTQLRGLVEAVMQPDQMFQPLLHESHSLGVALALSDHSAPPGQRALIGASDSVEADRTLLHRHVPLNLGGRHWMLSFSLVDDRTLASARGLAWLALLAGLVGTGLVALYLKGILEGRVRAEQLVAERTHALDQAQALDRLKNNFVNAISHDLRTPLTSIRGYTEFLEDEVGGPLAPAQQEFVGQIARGTERLEHLVDDLLDFARMDAGTFQLKREPANFAALVREVAASFAPMLKESHLDLALRFEAPEALEVRMDAARIERVLFNLSHNAIKFTPAGGTIVVRTSREDGVLRCEVVDSGIGIAPEQTAKLFQRFSQLEPGSHKGGTGLGLSIAKAIIEAHEGKIGVTSAPGKGSTFWFTLPLDPGT